MTLSDKHRISRAHRLEQFNPKVIVYRRLSVADNQSPLTEAPLGYDSNFLPPERGWHDLNL